MLKDPPKYQYYCEDCVQPLPEWRHTDYHWASGHSVKGFIWPPREKRIINRRVPAGRALIVLPCQALEVLV